MSVLGPTQGERSTYRSHLLLLAAESANLLLLSRSHEDGKTLLLDCHSLEGRKIEFRFHLAPVSLDYLAAERSESTLKQALSYRYGSVK